MRLFYFVLATSVAFALSGTNNAPTVCEKQQPQPAACTQMCDPSPFAINTCPIGYYCASDGRCDADCTATGMECGVGKVCNSDGRCQNVTGCNGLGCKV